MNTATDSDFVERAPFLVEITDYEFAVYEVLGDIDYIAQLSAIKDLLQRQEHADALLEEKIKEADNIARRSRGVLNDQAIDDYITHVHNSVFQDAAHSMACRRNAGSVDGRHFLPVVQRPTPRISRNLTGFHSAPIRVGSCPVRRSGTVISCRAADGQGKTW
jgi:hypothetical protein